MDIALAYVLLADHLAMTLMALGLFYLAHRNAISSEEGFGLFGVGSVVVLGIIAIVVHCLV